MDFIFSFFSVLFITLVIGCALAFGFVILMWIMGVAVVFAIFLYGRELLRRWIFLHNASAHPNDRPPEIIDGDYQDITDKH